jgi:molybdopterin-binding protein
MRLSARNQIPAQVISVTAGGAIANVELNAGGVRLIASITTEAVRELGLVEGREVTAVIKASDVILSVAD